MLSILLSEEPMAPRKLTDEEEKDAVGYYTDGETAQEIADYYSVSMQLIVNTLKKHDIPRRRNGPSSLIENPEFLAEARRLYEKKGWSQQKIADHLKTTQPQVSRALRKQGITKRRISGKNHGMWKGGKIILGGYIYVRVPLDHEFASMRNGSGYCAEHRLKMAAKLKRPLRRDETVHHKNLNKQDNHLRNLQLRQGNHGRGAAFKCRSCGSIDIVPVRLD